MNALASSQAPHHSSPCKHADSFALLLVLSKPKHRFGFGRRNGGAAVELSGLPGKRNGASPFGRYPLLHSSLPSRKSSLRLGDARRPYSAKAISSPASVAGGFQRGAHIPLWRAFFAALPRFASKRARSAPSPRKRAVFRIHFPVSPSQIRNIVSDLKGRMKKRTWSFRLQPETKCSAFILTRGRLCRSGN